MSWFIIYYSKLQILFNYLFYTFHHHRVVGGKRYKHRSKINVAQNSFARSSVGLCLFYFAEALVIFLVGFAIAFLLCRCLKGYLQRLKIGAGCACFAQTNTYLRIKYTTQNLIYQIYHN